MKYCFHCGAELEDDLKFCTQCGKAVSPDTQITQEEKLSAESASESVTTKTADFESNITDPSLHPEKGHTDETKEAPANTQSSDDVLSEALDTTFHGIGKLIHLGIQKWGRLSTKGKIGAVIAFLFLWPIVRRILFLY